MAFLLIVYLIYLVLYGIVSYAVIFHLTRYKLEGDRSRLVLNLYIAASATIIVTTLLLLRPA